MGKWAAVIGSPIAHSLSPVLHSRAYEILDLDWHYRKYDVDQESLAAFMGSVDEDCVGLSVTAPLKQVITKYVDVVDGLAKVVKNANTVVPSGPLQGAFNTDVHGIVQTLKPAFVTNEGELGSQTGAVPCVIGSGATAASAIAALITLGAPKVYLIGRSFAGPLNAFSIGTNLGVDVEMVPLASAARVNDALRNAPIVVSTVPPSVTSALATDLVPRAGSVLLDVTYGSGTSPLPAAFTSAGASVTSPLTMLVHQGIAQVKLMTNKEVPFDPIFEAVESAFSSRESGD